MNTPTTPNHAPFTPSRAGTLALLASAFVLAGLLLSQLNSRDVAARLAGPGAYAQAVNQGGTSEVSLLATDIGSEDALVVIDQRREELLLYRITGQKQIDFKGRESLRELFVQARGNVRRGMPATPIPGAPPSSPMR